MAQGACPGKCGYIGSIKSVLSHMNGCAEYVKRFAAGDELLSPVDELKARAAANRPAPEPRAPRVEAPELSDPAATVSSPSVRSRPARRAAAAAPAPARVPEPVTVERWELPSLHS